ncbi:MarR family winged helix-turn-helix transcriptional regulator [Shewanella aestuarii]|uniref:MarR family transcriptional regulator n=1 Tax=Shewanella aestuarii TaxID=1028752 RepID=A0A6G9QMX5_9GAMM|nr:MarR family transcriptional regulator [Shewanella aestuarii]QIR15407.1 MarR family transcriptional regulator [Shewanella aestuarii]
MEKYEQLLVSLRRVIRAIDIHSRQLNKQSGLTGPQLMVMQAIAALERPLAKEIAQAVALSSPTVVNIIDRLEARDLVLRTRSTSDKRKWHLSLSDAGVEILRSAPKPLQEHFINRYQNLDEYEQNQLLSAVEKIAYMMDAQELDAAPVLLVGQIQEES